MLDDGEILYRCAVCAKLYKTAVQCRNHLVFDHDKGGKKPKRQTDHRPTSVHRVSHSPSSGVCNGPDCENTVYLRRVAWRYNNTMFCSEHCAQQRRALDKKNGLIEEPQIKPATAILEAQAGVKAVESSPEPKVTVEYVQHPSFEDLDYWKRKYDEAMIRVEVLEQTLNSVIGKLTD